MRRRQFLSLGAALALPLPAFARLRTTSADKALQFQPKTSTSPAETHACLVRSTGAFSGAYTFAVQGRTTSQLRQGSAPNPWEVGWLFWNYVDDNHLYYFALKTNGWEVGRRDPMYVTPTNDGQRIIATGQFPALTLGAWNSFIVQVSGSSAWIYVNGQQVYALADTDPSPPLAGAVGMYCEDAAVEWNNVIGPFADNFDSYPVGHLAEGQKFGGWLTAYLGYGEGQILTL